ncbi:MAG: photosystem II stability/assembly factor-like uncharacterized protein [Verrucomicrobiales bacterium]|jgi:photosystem II stability/assembly factor-like uncharacterized protein
MLSHFLILLTLVTSDPTWVIQDAGVTTSIRGISAVSPEICWIGTKAGVARTVDAGKTWKFFKIGGDELDFRDLEAIDENECIAMSAGEGDASRIYRTADGGESWKLVFQNHEAKGFFNGIAFHNEKQGILAGDPIGGRLYLLATEDRGKTWQRIAEDAAPEMADGEHAFAASGTHVGVDCHGRVWVTSGGKVARVFYSADWGRRWEAFATPMIAGEPSTGIFSIVSGAKLGIAVGGDYKKESEGRDNAMRSSDGGKSWSLIKKADGSAPFAFRSCVGWVDSTTLVAVGPSGTDVSRNSGETWKALPGEVGFHTLSIAGGVVWAAGAEGRVGRLEF